MLALLAALAATTPLKYRLVFTMTNLFRPEEADRLCALIQRAAPAGYNGLVFADSKLQSLPELPDFYIKNFKKVQAAADANHIRLIPSVLPVGYSSGMLAQNVNLVEGMPVVDAPFKVKNGQAQLDPDPAESLPNGGFENVQGDKIQGLAYQDAIGQTTFSDTDVVHGGKHSVRMDNPGSSKDGNGNCRLVQPIKLKPWRQYHVSAWIKTQDFDQAASTRIAVLDAKGASICFQDIPVKPTQDWTQVHITFNSGARDAANLYFGVWGGNKGKLWWDDATFEEVGLLNVIRRAGCPLQVKGEDGTTYREGEDFDKVVDPHLGTVPWAGGYEIYHESPAIKIIPGSRIKEGQKLKVSFYAATLTMQDQVNICVSEPEWTDIAKNEIRRTNDLMHPTGIFFSHDEMRVGNWCKACQDRHLTPGQELAQNIAQCAQLEQQAHPGAEMFVWSDMFDPFHNAHDNYYLVNGDLKGSWEGLPKSMIVVNWNSGGAKNSLPFFDKLGLTQVLAGFYDGPVDSIKTWLHQAEGLKHVQGVMYTTWVGDYSKLEQFAKAAWGADAK